MSILRRVQAAIRTLHPKNNDFFTDLEALANFLRQGTNQLMVLLNAKPKERVTELARLKEIERTVDGKVKAMQERLVATFVTPIDAGDILSISGSFGRVMHELYDAGEVTIIYDGEFHSESILEVSSLIAASVERLVKATSLLANPEARELIPEQVQQVVEFERRGDRNRFAVLQSGFEALKDPAKANTPITFGEMAQYVAHYQMTEKFERALDWCRNAASALDTAASRAK